MNLLQLGQFVINADSIAYVRLGTNSAVIYFQGDRTLRISNPESLADLKTFLDVDPTDLPAQPEADADE
jgi:hypothetical protein